MWEWLRPLGEDEYFLVRIRPEGDPKPPACCYLHKKEPRHSGHLYGCTDGRHYWSVIVVHGDPESSTGWKEISKASEERWFDLVETDDDEKEPKPRREKEKEKPTPLP
jgi:hypothetical protein